MLTRNELDKWMVSTGSDAQRIGIECELFICRERGHAVPFTGIERFLDRLGLYLSARPTVEGNVLIGLELPSGGNVSLEPGGQVELSGGTFCTLHEVWGELACYLQALQTVGASFGFSFLGIGTHPFARLEEIPWIPKQRYNIMRRYLSRYHLAHRMMKQTCTVQVNLDYRSEEDMRRKVRLAALLQPYITALFSSSSFLAGRDTGYVSYRRYIWQHVDPERTGDLTFMREPDFSFRRWVDYALETPMFFILRHGHYSDVAGASFVDFMQGRLAPWTEATLEDFKDHLSTLFPEVRLKNYLEMRGADSGPSGSFMALAALWVGLLYDPKGLNALEAFVKLLPVLSPQDVARWGMRAVSSARFVYSGLLRFAEEGLRRRAYLKKGRDESVYLRWLYPVVGRGYSISEELRRRIWRGEPYQETVRHMFNIDV